MTTLTEFLLARIAETETIARDARHGDEPEAGMAWGYFADCCNGVHIHCNPEVILAECAATRRIVGLCDTKYYMSMDPGEIGLANQVAEALALPYADHPDYDPSWRP